MEFTTCKHENLTFAESAYLVICVDCKMSWAQQAHPAKLNSSLVHMKDIRGNPRCTVCDVPARAFCEDCYPVVDCHD